MPRKSRNRIATTIIARARLAALTGILLGIGACQTARVQQSGFLTGYERLALPGGAMKKATYRYRDGSAFDAIARVFIESTVLSPDLETALTPPKQGMALREVDRQICLEESERFAMADAPGADTRRVRTTLIRLESASRAGSTAAAAAAGFFNPVPLLDLRLPGTTGGLAVESELLSTDDRQVAAVVVRRRVQLVDMTKPSLSRAGDALQLAEPLGDAVGKAFASKARAEIRIGSPDPCVRFGPRCQIGRSIAGALLGFGSGLYVPQVAGTGARAGDAYDPRVCSAKARPDPPLPIGDPPSMSRPFTSDAQPSPSPPQPPTGVFS